MATQIEKKTFKTMNPTCHSFNTSFTSSDSIPLLVGFNTGIITLQDLIRKDVCKVFNEEVCILSIHSVLTLFQFSFLKHGFKTTVTSSHFVGFFVWRKLS